MGYPTVFCRFSGCNKWSGKEIDRNDSVCSFCDTDFSLVYEYTEDELIYEIINKHPTEQKPRITFTGGEPALQLKKSTVLQLFNLGYNISLETNGSILIDYSDLVWLTISPKDLNIKLVEGNELKILFPCQPEILQVCSKLKFDNYYLQPIYSDRYEENLNSAIEYCLNYTKWALSIQQHKYLRIK